jgi:S-formylglutathione hydrolase FrmB/alpha-beta hydrolase superfamily lysophospholipase
MIRVKSLLAVLLATLLAGCTSSPAARTPPAPAQSANFGDIIGQAPLTDVDPAIANVTSSSHLVTYLSSDGVNDGLGHVTASIYVPNGAPPQGGFPIVALGRPVTGTGPGCTSSATDVADHSPTTIAALLQAGYVVVVPDYLGLGQPSDNQANFHPFLDSATVAENMIDAVRATRNVVPQASALWVAVGTGQGGQAAWAANELADDYGHSLNLRGAVSISPTADVEGLADAAAAGTLSTEQKLAYITYLDALSKEYQDDFHLEDYRRGVVAQNWDLLLGCESDQAAQRASISTQITPDDLQPATPDALTILRGYLHKTNLPQGPTQAPMLVVFGTKDPLIPAEWTQRALDRACAMGDVIAIQKQPDDSPPVIDPASTLNWIADRFADASAPNDCAAASTVDPTQVSAPAAVPQPLPPAQTPPSDTGTRSGTSLISGWLPIVIQGVALAVLLAAIGWRSRRWRLRWLPFAGAVGLVVAATAYWYVDYQGWGHDPPWGMWVWIAVTGLALAVVVLGWPSAPWWRRVVSILAVPLAAISAADVLNVSLGYLPTVRTAWEMATGAQPPDWIDESRLAAMVRDGVQPTRGTIVSVKIPDDQSGFIHRDELVYLPPVWFESSPPPRLPAVMMIGAEMGGPQNWLPAGSGDAQRILDEFALKHRGTTPVVVFPDSNGAFDNDTECVNGSRGNAADHLTKDVVPYVISRFGASAEPSNWGVVGWSAGGTCALTLSVMHPELFSAFVDLDGELGPNAGSKEQTTARLFGSDADAWAAFDPKSVVETRGQYSGVSAWIGVSGQTPTVYRPGTNNPPTDDALGYWDTSDEEFASTADQLCQLLSGHGIECAVSSYSGAHDFTSAGNGLAAALPWLAGKIGTPGVPRRPLPGGPPTG